jgi:1-aminocyclopropane-1-carboxylate deaminase
VEDHNQPVDLSKAAIHSLPDERLQKHALTIDVLRLDRIHPVVSGNKWFKLKYHLQQALQQHKKGIVTFGGAWSNHLVATAFACRQAGLACIGIVRGEDVPSATLQDARSYGMQLQFVPRSFKFEQEDPDYFIVPMGGQSGFGVDGAAEIVQTIDRSLYSHIACAVGTGTMMAGLVKASLPHQQVLGISSLKLPNSDNNSLYDFVVQQGNNFRIFYDYHFGGYARKTNELIAFMNELYKRHQLPTDFVYTAKLLFGIYDLAAKGYFAPGSGILIIHSGGLQGNRSLPEGTLTFL